MKDFEEKKCNSIINPFILKKRKKKIKDRIIRDIRTLTEEEENNKLEKKNIIIRYNN